LAGLEESRTFQLAEKDLQRFLQKVNHLNGLVQSLHEHPERRQQLAACDDHNSVVELARSWGFEIARRWGDGEEAAMDRPANNLLLSQELQPGEEQERMLCQGPGWRLMRIESCAASSPEDFWYDQAENEWLTLMRGSARLQFKDPDESLDLSVGDQLLIPAHRRHRLERTDPSPGTLWLALYWPAGSSPPFLPLDREGLSV
jgi:cupin 2 domain-containing protein